MTAADIAVGAPRDWFNCPIVLGAQRAGLRHVSVTAEGICWASGRVDSFAPFHRRRALPAAARAFVLAFDAGLPVEPLTFEL